MRTLLLVVLCLNPCSTLRGQEWPEDRIAELEARLAALEHRWVDAASIQRIYVAVRDGVVRVQSALGHGTGFFVSIGGRRMIVTNEHVINDPNQISVYVDSITRIRARLLIADETKDLALLDIAPTVCPRCPPLPIASASTLAQLYVGSPIVAVGYPLNQVRTLTSGIISAIRPGAIISDVNLNPGNSGGPLLSMRGEVIAVGTFVDQGTVGPGISGAVTIDVLQDLINQADFSGPAPVDGPLPIAGGSYPMDRLRAVVEEGNDEDVKQYQRYLNIDGERFNISVFTPVMHVRIMDDLDSDVAKDRRRREERSSIPTRERYRQVDVYRDWMEYVGSLNRAVVTLQVTPKVGETGGSIARGILGGLTRTTMNVTYRYQGDVRRVTVLRNSIPVTPIMDGIRPLHLNTVTQLLDMRDVAFEAVIILDPLDFYPDVGGVAPQIDIQIEDLKNPTDTVTVHLEPETVARIWNDFVPFLRTSRPVETFLTAYADIPEEDWISQRYEIPFDDAYGIIAKLIADSNYRVHGGQDYSTGRVQWMVLAPGSIRRIRVHIKREGRRAVQLWVLTDETDAMARKLFEMLDSGLSNLAPSS